MKTVRVSGDDPNDFVGYEVLIDFMERYAVYELEGDIVEIGAFMGGGTAKLAQFAEKCDKKVYAIDIFDPTCDTTQDLNGIRMCDIYEAFLQGRSQMEIYQDVTQRFKNIITINKDSKEVEFAESQDFIFGFIDGNHKPDYVKNDFYIIWPHIVPGGCVGFHDYDFDLPYVTCAIDKLIHDHRDEIGEIHKIKEKHIVLLVKKKL